jgi:hypothetical protein
MAKANHIQGTLSGPYNQPDRAYIVNDHTLERAVIKIDPASRDLDNTTYRTTYLRAGLGLGAGAGALGAKHYVDGGANDPCIYVLDEDVDLLDEFGAAVTGPVMASVLVKGFLDAAHLNANVDAAGVTNLKAAGFIFKADYQ